MNNFDDCVGYEVSQQPRADRFYKSMGASSIIRWNYNTPEGKQKQMADIDCTVSFYNRPDPVNISEKFRKSDWGDMFVELWSNIEAGTPGWTSKSEADIIYYYVPGSVYEIDAKALKNLADEIIKQYSARSINAIMSSYDHAKINVHLNNKAIILNIRKTQSERDNPKGFFSNTVGKKSTWSGIGVCISWDILKDLGINIKRYNLF